MWVKNVIFQKTTAQTSFVHCDKQPIYKVFNEKKVTRFKPK